MNYGHASVRAADINEIKVKARQLGIYKVRQFYDSLQTYHLELRRWLELTSRCLFRLLRDVGFARLAPGVLDRV